MEENKKPQFKIFKFNEAYQPPQMKYNQKLNIVEWGDKNLYPKYVLDTYNNFGSSIHKNIINKKNKLATGKGFKEILDPKLLAFVKANKLEKEVIKAGLDYELFNGFAFEVVWNNAGDDYTSIQHIPFSKLRIGIEDENMNFPHVWFSNDWEKYKKEGYEPEMIRTFNKNIKSGKQVYFYTEYNPASDGLYPIPGYSTSFNWIELEYQISIFHLNQAKQGYSPSFLLSFNTGIPTEEEMDEFNKEFKRNYSGTENAGKIIITYAEGADGAPTFQKIDLNDSDERFIMLMDQIESHIVAGAEIPPMLVILSPGKLGSSAERKELLEEFQQSYVTPRQETLEYCLNDILGVAGYTEELALQKYIEEDAPVANDKEAEARATLKGSVGGVQGIIQIQTSVAQGLTSRSSAQALLELIYGFTSEDSLRLLGDVQEASVPAAVQSQLNEIKNKL